jgi:hypothetical protein
MFDKVRESVPIYARISLLLIAGGLGIISPGFKDIFISLTKQVTGQPPPAETPYWVGLILIFAGVCVFCVFALGLIGRGSPTKLAFKIRYPNGDQAIFRPKNDSRIRVGRSEDNDLILRDPYVSKHHCILQVKDSRVGVTDLNATNVTKISGVETRGGILDVNETLTLGETTLTLVQDS